MGVVDHARAEWSDVFASFARMGVADGVAIHHTASAACPWDYDPQVLRNLEHGEMAVGYNALAYHVMGFNGGATAESRPEFAMGAATGGHNGHTVALCGIGYFHPPFNHVPSDNLVHSFARVIYDWRQRGVITPDAIVRPHTWWTAGTQWATSCCGDGFIWRVAEIEQLSYTGAVSPTPTPRKGSSTVIMGWILFMGQVNCYLIGSTGEVLHEYPQEDINAFGFPADALQDNLPRFKLTPTEWQNIINHHNVRGAV